MNKPLQASELTNEILCEKRTTGQDVDSEYSLLLLLAYVMHFSKAVRHKKYVSMERKRKEALRVNWEI